MSYPGLMQDRVRGWRPIETLPTSGRGVPGVDWLVTEEGDEINAAVQQQTGVVRDAGPGDVGEGRWMVYMAALVDIERRDVVEVLEAVGATAGTLLYVDKAYRPRGHHLELTCRRYTGAAPVA